tara:strand:+ start:454 stop:1821 length:1368 start_codon:yes stop_codon:yes gene_type:complete
MTLVLDNTNRPDSGLYHLPYVSFINEHRISIGLANLHERFGIISIIQYLSAINLNLFFKINGTLIPLVIIYSIVLVFFFQQFIKKNNSDLEKFVSFLYIIFILSTSNRYSSFGNDAPAQFFYMVLIYYFLQTNKNIRDNDLFKLICLFSLFAFLIKPFFIITLIIPILYVFNKFERIETFKQPTLIFLFIFIIWILKNIIVTGCMIYPIEITCFKEFDWTLNPNKFSLESKAWSKGWPDRYDKSVDYEKYLENYYWIKIWLKNHLKFIILKLLPFILTLLIVIFIIILKNKKKNIIYIKELKQLFILNILFILIWFFSFPAYRFGSAIIVTTISILIINIFFKKLSFKNILFKKTLNFFLIFFCILIIMKNVLRVYENYENIYADYPWPKIYSRFSDNRLLVNTPIKKNNEILYYQSPEGELCFYSKSPCTHIRNLKIKKIEYFKFYDKYIINNK